MYVRIKRVEAVVRELLVCTQPHHHETSTALWNLYHRVSSRGRCAQICFSQGAHSENPENDHHFGFTKKVYGLPISATPQQHNTVHNSIDNSVVGTSLNGAHIYIAVGSSPKGHCYKYIRMHMHKHTLIWHSCKYAMRMAQHTSAHAHTNVMLSIQFGFLLKAMK